MSQEEAVGSPEIPKVTEMGEDGAAMAGVSVVRRLMVTVSPTEIVAPVPRVIISAESVCHKQEYPVPKFPVTFPLHPVVTL